MKFIFFAGLLLLVSCGGQSTSENPDKYRREIDGFTVEYIQNEFTYREHVTAEDVLGSSSKLFLDEPHSQSDVSIKIIIDVESSPSLSQFNFSLIPAAQASSPYSGLKYGIYSIRVLSDIYISDKYPKGSDITEFFSLIGYPNNNFEEKSVIPLETTKGKFPGYFSANYNELIPIAVIAFDEDSIIDKGSWTFTVELTLESEHIYLFKLPEIQLY